MDYQLIIFLSKKELMAVDITEDGDCEEVSIDGNSSMKYFSSDDFKDFAQYICDAYNVDTIEEMEAGATIVNCGADADAEIALLEQLKDFKGIDCIDVKKLLPIVAQQKGLIRKGSKQIVSVMGNCFAVKCDDDGVVTVGKNKVTEAVELTGADFAFLYFFQSEGSGISEEEINKYKAEIEAVKTEAETRIEAITKNFDEKLNHLEAECSQYKQIVEMVQYEKESVKNKFSDICMGDIIKFGKYFIDDDSTMQDIEWQVLDVEEDKALLISKFGLEAMSFDNSEFSWDTSYLRRWLKGTFFKRAFSKEEVKYIAEYETSDGIIDNVFLLNSGEARKYFSNDTERICTYTAYAKSKGSDNAWWLRDFANIRVQYGDLSYEWRNEDSKYLALGDGKISNSHQRTWRCNEAYKTSGVRMVRPAIWVSIL